MKTLVLASTSPYRAELLQRLGIPFETSTPDCDETPQALESPADLVKRLSLQKAQSLKSQYSNALIIGSDQVAERDGLILGKPGNHQNAMGQLQAASGRCVMFHTGICVYDTSANSWTVDRVKTQVRFRMLTSAQIAAYLKAEEPYDCAGSFKSERLGITLFESITGDDPTALIGLPLIRLTSMLNDAGFAVLR